MKAEIDVSEGDIIFYRLEPKSLPVNPERIWKGRVEWSPARKGLFMIVSSLEEGYEGMSEIVYTPKLSE